MWKSRFAVAIGLSCSSPGSSIAAGPACRGRNHNLFWAEPIKVDWKDWRRVSIPTPPIPAGYADKNRTFLFEPCYPLNLAFNAKAEGEGPVEIRFDRLRVVTHLAREDWQRLDIEYPDETRIHPVGAPLTAIITNLAHDPVEGELKYTLRQAQGFVAAEKKLPLKLAAGAQQRVTLLEHLGAGAYELQVAGFGPSHLWHANLGVRRSQVFRRKAAGRVD